MPRLSYAVLVLLAAASLTACSRAADEETGPVALGVADLSDAERAACRTVLEAAPAEFVGLAARTVTPDGATGRAWGSPAVRLTCEFAMPVDFTPGASCEEVNGVGWYVPIEQFSDLTEDLTIYTIGRTPIIKLTVPAVYRREAAFSADALVTLADPVKTGIPRADACV